VRYGPITLGRVLARGREQVESVYFPHSGILSFVVDLLDGEAIENFLSRRSSWPYAWRPAH
jgi:hypothetical protein